MRNTLLTFFLGLCIAFPSFSQWDTIEVKTINVTEHIFMLKARGGNIALLTGEDGLFMVDAQYAPLSEKIIAAASELSPEPLRFLLNTHWHGDHTGGNENFANQGATVVAHTNVRKRLLLKEIKKEDGSVSKLPDEAIPDITFEEGIQFHVNGEDIIVYHFHKAHTDGDAVVYFPVSNVVHMGDLYFEGRYPYIDISSGGHVDGVIEAANQVLFLSDEETVIIPGHGPLSNINRLSEYRDMIYTIRTKVKAAIDKGHTLDEIQEMGLSAEYDEEYGTGFIKPERFIKSIYRSFKPGG